MVLLRLERERDQRKGGGEREVKPIFSKGCVCQLTIGPASLHNAS